MLDETRFAVDILEDGRFRPVPAQVTPMGKFSTDEFSVYVVGPRGGRLEPGATYSVIDKLAVASLEQTRQRRTAGHRPVASHRPRDGSATHVTVKVDRRAMTGDVPYAVRVRSPAYGQTRLVPRDAWGREFDGVEVQVSASLPPELEEWGDRLLYRFVLDGGLDWVSRDGFCDVPMPGRSALGSGRERLVAECDIQEDRLPRAGRSNREGPLAPGRYSVRMEAHLPGTGVVLRTPAESVDLRCPGEQ